MGQGQGHLLHAIEWVETEEHQQQVINLEGVPIEKIANEITGILKDLKSATIAQLNEKEAMSKTERLLRLTHYASEKEDVMARTIYACLKKRGFIPLVKHLFDQKTKGQFQLDNKSLQYANEVYDAYSLDRGLN